jgi:predicted DsbA family dithiol-disulfide isomerase
MVDQPAGRMRIVVYGDFNCPYSCLASSRAGLLAERALAEVEWRAVEHDPGIPAPSEPVDGELAAMLDREVAEVAGLVRPGEDFSIRRPPVHPNTAAATGAFAAAAQPDASGLRRRLFGALWSEGRDIGDPAVVSELAGTSSGGHADEAVAAWREAWLGLERRVVPMLVLPDGYVSRGLGALARLADLAR